MLLDPRKLTSEKWDGGMSTLVSTGGVGSGIVPFPASDEREESLSLVSFSVRASAQSMDVEYGQPCSGRRKIRKAPHQDVTCAREAQKATHQITKRLSGISFLSIRRFGVV